MPIPVQGRSIGLGHEREWHGAKGGKGEWVAVYFFFVPIPVMTAFSSPTYRPWREVKNRFKSTGSALRGASLFKVHMPVPLGLILLHSSLGRFFEGLTADAPFSVLGGCFALWKR